MAADSSDRVNAAKRNTGAMLRMVTSPVAPDAVIIGNRFDLGRTAAWRGATSDAWFSAIDVTSDGRAWVYARPTRALGSEETRALGDLGALRCVATPLAHARPGELPAWVAYASEEAEPVSELLEHGPTTIAEAVALGRALCDAVEELQAAGRAVPALVSANVLMSRADALTPLRVLLVGAGLAWPAAPSDEGAMVQAVAAVVFEALTTRRPTLGHVPRLALARPELASSTALETVLRRALGAEGPPLAGLGELRNGLAASIAMPARALDDAPGLPRLQSSLMSVSELAPLPAPQRAPARPESPPPRRTLWWLLAALLLIGLGVGLGLLLAGDEPAAPDASLAAPTPTAPVAPPAMPAPSSPAPNIGPKATTPALAAPGTADAPPAPTTDPNLALVAEPAQPLPAVVTPPGPEAAAMAPVTAPIAAVPTRVRINVTSTPPGSAVLREGKELGVTPLALDVAADELPFEIALARAGYVTRRLTIEKPSSPEAELAFELVKKPRGGRAARPALEGAEKKPTPRPPDGEFIFER